MNSPCFDHAFGWTPLSPWRTIFNRRLLQVPLLTAALVQLAGGNLVLLSKEPVAATNASIGSWTSSMSWAGDGWRTYDAFNLPAPAMLTQVTWVGFSWDESTNLPASPAITEWNVSIHEGSTTAPGALVHTTSLAPAQVSSVALPGGSFRGQTAALRRYTATLSSPVTIFANKTYWLSPFARHQNLNPIFSWWASGPGSSYQDRYIGFTIHSTYSRSGDRAYSLIGQPLQPGLNFEISGDEVANGGSYAFLGPDEGGQPEVSVRILNMGPVTQSGISASITPAGNGDFQVSQPPVTSLAVGASTTFPLSFTPAGPGLRTGVLRVAGGTFGTYQANLSGPGVTIPAPVMALTFSGTPVANGGSRGFGETDIGTPVSQTVTITNTGTASLTGIAPTIFPAGNPDFSIGSPPMLTTLGSGASTSFTVVFSPQTVGSRTATVRVSSNAGGSPYSVNVSGTGRLGVDLEPPVITNPAADLTLECGEADNATLVDAWLAAHGGAAAIDNQGAVAWSHNFTGIPPACSSVSVTFTATDDSGNFTNTNALLSMQDTVAPQITSPAADLTLEAGDPGNYAAIHQWQTNRGSAIATDACATPLWSNDYTGAPTGALGTAMVTFTAVDGCGNASHTSANLIVQDTLPPVMEAGAVDYYGKCATGAEDLADFLASNGGAYASDAGSDVTWTHDSDGMLPVCEEYVVVTFTASDASGHSVSTSSRFFLFPPGAVWTGDPAGSWTTVLGWDGGTLPTAARDTYVDLFDFQDTVLQVPSGSRSTKNLIIGQGDVLHLGGSGSVNLTVAGDTIRNAGEVHIQGSSLRIGGSTHLTGNGRLVLTGDGSNRIERGNSSSLDVLTVSSDQEITTSGATEAEYQHTSIHAGLINHGTVTADTGGMTLYLEPKINHGTFRAINGGLLRMQSPVDNVNGTLFAGAGSSLWLQNTLGGGMVTGAGRLLMNSSAGLSGPLTLDSGIITAVEGGTTSLVGAIVNDSEILLSVPGGGSAAILSVDGSVILEGSGKVVLQGAGNRRIMRANSSVLDVLTVGAEQEITATAGTIAEYQNGAIHAGLINHGTITADGSGLTFYSNAKTNLGLFRAANGGLMRMETPVNNAEGTLFAGENSILKLENTLTGGIVTGSGRLVMNSAAGIVGPITLDSGLTTAIEGSTTALTGNINLNGQLHLGVAGSATGATLDINGAVSLTGTGRIVLQGNNTTRLIERASSLVSDVLTLHAGLEITTNAGTVASSQRAGIKAGLVNHGMITADEGGLALTHNNKTNHGTFRAINGGNLVITGSTITNYNATTDTLTGGRWEVISSGTTTTLDIPSSPITTIASDTFVCLSGIPATFPQLSTLNTVAGTLCLENGKSFTTSGNLALPGNLEFGLTDGSVNGFDTGRIFVNGNVNFTGATIHIRDRGITAGIYEIVRWTGSPTGMPVLGNLPLGLNYRLLLDEEGKVLRLQVIDNLPEIIAVHHNAATGTTSIDYQSVVDVIDSVKGTQDFVDYDDLPDTEPGTGGVMQYIHPSEAAPDRYFYLFATDK